MTPPTSSPIRGSCETRRWPAEGLKHDSAVHCDELVSLPKAVLTNYVGSLTERGLILLESALLSALDISNREGFQ